MGWLRPQDGEYMLPEEVIQAFVTYYALHHDKPTEEARLAIRQLMRAGLRAFVYSSLGIVPGVDPRQKYFDRHINEHRSGGILLCV